MQTINDLGGLRPKRYSFLIDYKGNTTEPHLANVIKSDASRDIRHNRFLDHQQRPGENYLQNHRIGSRLNQIYSIEVGGKSFEKIHSINISMIDFIKTLLFYPFYLFYFTQ